MCSPRMIHLIRYFCFMIVVVSLAMPIGAVASDESEAVALTTLFRSARAVIAKNKSMIKDPTTAGISLAEALKQVRENYLHTTGHELASEGGVTTTMNTAIETVFNKAIGGGFKDEWPSGKFANKFLPARFAKEVADEFGTLTGGKAIIKLTAPDELIVNPSNTPDIWESRIINSKFKATDWVKGKTYSENSTVNGKEAFRLMLPEYYGANCMGCHGGDAGKAIHKGKVAGKLGDLGGAISVAFLK